MHQKKKNVTIMRVQEVFNMFKKIINWIRFLFENKKEKEISWVSEEYIMKPEDK